MSEDVTDVDVAEHLVPLEEALWRRATRFDQAWMEPLLHPDFHEFGRSGRRWSREEVLGMAALDLDVRWPPQDLITRLVAPEVALLTYSPRRPDHL